MVHNRSRFPRRGPDDFGALDRISTVTFPGPKIVSYTYDDLTGGSAADYPGQRTQIAYPDNKTATYTYLADGKMSTVTDWLAKQTAYTYDDAGRVAQSPRTSFKSLDPCH